MTADPTSETTRYRCAEEAHAAQWTGSNAEQLRAFCGSDFDTIDPEDRGEDPDETAAVRSHPHGGWIGLKPGDWAVKHADHFSAASDEEFRERWAPVPAPSADQGATDRPEVDDPRVLALAKARQQMAYKNPFNVVCPPWGGLTEQEQQLSLLDARNYLRAALDAGLVPAAPVAAPPTGQADETQTWFVPPAAEGLPLAALDSATEGADRLDAWARDPHGRNFLAHALVQLARDGWLRQEAGDGFEVVRDRETPEPEDPDDPSSRLAAETPGPETQGEAQQDEEPETDCTCGSAGDAFVPLGHYRDCPAAVAEPHPTEADLRHALAVAAKFHGQDATAPAVVAEPGKEA